MKMISKVQLSLMMFLEFFIWGGWFVTMGSFLHSNLSASDAQIGQAYSTQSFGAILAPFIVGLIADRFFNAERILGVLHIVGGVLMFQMANAQDFSAFYPYVLGYMILYMPTLALVNSVSFNQMKDPAKEFSVIRVWGTIGWIVAGLTISYFAWDSQMNVESGLLKNTFLMTASASVLLGLFSFSLPKTPPKYTKGEKISISHLLGLEALKLLKSKNFLLFFISSVLICIPLAFYYQYTNLFLTSIGVEESAAKMTVGQVSEVAFMLLLPFFVKRLGIKWTLLLGMFAWGVRYLLFAYGDSGEGIFMLLVGIALHGVCYDFFFVSGQIYTNAKAGEKIKSAAQGLITLATYGVGMLIGFQVAAYIAGTYVNAEGSYNWSSIWLFPFYFSVAILILFALVFKNEKVAYKD